MKLSNFEEFIDDTILQRGLNYFNENRVSIIAEIEKGHFRAVVEGSDDYTVDIWLGSEGKIVDLDCDCPYDWGDFCKHQAAVLYALNDNGVKNDNPKSNKIKKFEKFPRQDLNITGADEVAACKKLIREYVNRAKHKGFIEWNKAGYAMEGAWQVLNKAREKLESGDALQAVTLCITVLSIVVDVLQFCDESGGEVGSVISEAIELINEAADVNFKEMGLTEQKKLFAVIAKEALHERYEGWSDWRFDLLRACTGFCGIPEFRTTLEQHLNEMLKALSIDDYSSKYNICRIKQLQLDLIEHYDGPGKAEKFIQDNIRFDEFREKAIISAFDKAKYENVLRYCLDGEEIDKGYAGLINKWKKYRYLAYEKLGDIENQRKIALEILFNNEFEYYLKLKKLYQPAEWQAVLENIFSVFEKQTYKQPIYVQILIEEGLTLALLEYCRQNVTQIENLYQHLIDKHYEEVNELFIKYIKHQALIASDRKQYKKVCAKIKTYKKVFGNIEADKIINELKQVHCRRPAFLDELGRIK